MSFAWSPNPEPDIHGYVVSYGTTSGVYPLATNVGLSTNVTISSLAGGTTYYFIVTAYNEVGLESDPSVEIVHQTPIEPFVMFGTTILRTNTLVRFSLVGTPGGVVTVEASTNFFDWVPLRTNRFYSTNLTITITDPEGASRPRFYRAVLR